MNDQAIRVIPSFVKPRSTHLFLVVIEKMYPAGTEIREAASVNNSRYRSVQRSSCRQETV